MPVQTESPWFRRAKELLGDGPRPLNELFAETGGLIPPGQAWRERESGRDWGRRKHQGLPAEPDEVTDPKIWAGRRRIFTKAIWAAVRRGTMTREEREGVLWIGLPTKTSSGSSEPKKSE